MRFRVNFGRNILVGRQYAHMVATSTIADSLCEMKKKTN